MSCEVDGCVAERTFEFTRVESRRPAFIRRVCDEHARRILLGLRNEPWSMARGPSEAPGLVSVDFETLIYHFGPEERPGCVYLHEAGGTRRFATMVDTCAWSALLAQVEKREAPMPPTHAGWAATISELGGDLRDVVVDEPARPGQHYEATLRIRKGDRPLSVRVRPSDAYVLAALLGVPIFATEGLLESFTDGGGRKR